mmetsp:Transcript_7280/g.32290  ORF Transcript_7280/g.32290 Transcript_7280/m.32290 type:complete len:252 (+) Transcript_7280:580-1335(+)
MSGQDGLASIARVARKQESMLHGSQLGTPGSSMSGGTSDQFGTVESPVKSSAGHGSSPSGQHVDALLPKQTVVTIVGNNRTKSDLIGRQGVVKGAQTLGGWHEVLLEHGGLVRVQRNALRVISMPVVSTIPQMVAPLGLASPDRGNLMTSEAGKGQSSHSSGGSSKRRGESGIHPTPVKIDKLDLSSLRRYRNVFNLKLRKDCTREELVFAVRKHFSKTTVNEHEVIVNFVRRLSKKYGQIRLGNGTKQAL